MAKLNQIIALEKGAKSAAERALTDVYQKLEKRDLLTGFTKVYRPKDEEGEKLPPENKKVQFTVKAATTAVMPELVRAFDTVATKEVSNTKAKADVVVNGTVLIKDAPVSLLLFLEKQLQNLHAFVSRWPTLPADQDWDMDTVSGLWRTPERQTHRTKKNTKHSVIVPPTDKHPAQVAVITEDEIVGYWNTINLSGEVPPTEVKSTLEKIEALQRAVKVAREEANSLTVEDKPIGQTVLGYIFN